MDQDDVKPWLDGLEDAAMLTPCQALLPQTALGAEDFLGDPPWVALAMSITPSNLWSMQLAEGTFVPFDSTTVPNPSDQFPHSLSHALGMLTPFPSPTNSSSFGNALPTIDPRVLCRGAQNTHDNDRGYCNLMPYFDNSNHPPTPPMDSNRDRSLPSLATQLGPYVHPNTNGGNGMGPPSPSDFLFHGPKLPPIDSLRELASPLNPKKRKLDPPSPTHSVGKPLRPPPLPHRYEQYAFKPKRPSTASSSTCSTIQPRHGMPLAPMRRLDLSDDEDEMHDGEDEMDQDDGDGDELDSGDESADRKSLRDAPFRQVTPSDASVELDDDYIPLSSIRSRAIGRSKHPRKAAKPAPKPVPKPKAPKTKITENKTTETKKTKLTRGAAGERRMSQNRSAQKKYRDKNKRLADLRSDFNLATIQATSEYKAGNITGDEAMERLTNASDYFRTEMTATCSMTGQRLEEEITEMDE